MVIDGQFLSKTSDMMHGCGAASGSSNMFYIGVYNSKWIFRAGSKGSQPANADTNRHVFTVTPGTAMVGNTSYTLTGNQTSEGLELYLFGRKNASSISYTGGFKMYSCQIYQNNTLVRDFIPVKSNGVGCLYDKVTKQLFANQGSGSFSCDPNV